MCKEKIRKMWIADQGDGTYKNPILYTDYSDPDAIRVGKDYFMIASSFSNTPAIPILHSNDLVNWKVINYVCESLPFERYATPQHGCGVWAPSIRFHNGLYYVFIPFPDEGIMMSCTSDPWGKWSPLSFVHKVTGWIDPCPFWDDDGNAYMINAFARSRIGIKSFLYISPMTPECSGIIDEGRFVFDGHMTQPTIEGPKLYKRNGYYYIFAPAGGVATGWQTVLRSRNIYGPYEEKIVMCQGSSPINGPHQGAWVDTPDGEDWFIHFQDVGNAGRVIHLQPMRWVNDWPVIGEDTAGTGCGQPVLHHAKPSTDAVCTPNAPDDSDFFESAVLGLQWQWSANSQPGWYSLESGLTLYSQLCNHDTQLPDVPNVLSQKWPSPEFIVSSPMNITGLAEGDISGMISLGNSYAALAVKRAGGKNLLIHISGHRTQADEITTVIGELESETVHLRMTLRTSENIMFEYSTDGAAYIPAGKPHKASPGQWVGSKVGLFAINPTNTPCGHARFENFIFRPVI